MNNFALRERIWPDPDNGCPIVTTQSKLTCPVFPAARGGKKRGGLGGGGAGKKKTDTDPHFTAVVWLFECPVPMFILRPGWGQDHMPGTKVAESSVPGG